MLSKEEKEAIEILKKLQKKTPYIIWGDGTPYNKNNQIQTILNLIEKQQKEIEEKTTIIMAGSEKVKQLEKEIEELKKKEKEKKAISQAIIRDTFIDRYISKDKIREKLNQINNEYSILLSNKSLSLERQNMNAQRHEAMRVVLEELLEENNNE